MVVARANDYTRMFSTAGRRAAPAHPESPRRDKKPRAALAPPPDLPDGVELRERTPADRADRSDRLSASDFYTVSEDVTPQPFKGLSSPPACIVHSLRYGHVPCFMNGPARPE